MPLSKEEESYTLDSSPRTSSECSYRISGEELTIYSKLYHGQALSGLQRAGRAVDFQADLWVGGTGTAGWGWRASGRPSQTVWLLHIPKFRWTSTVRRGQAETGVSGPDGAGGTRQNP